MRLADEPFEKIKSGEKTVEIRLIRLKVENKNRSQKSGRFFIGNVCLVLKIGQLMDVDTAHTQTILNCKEMVSNELQRKAAESENDDRGRKCDCKRP